MTQRMACLFAFVLAGWAQTFDVASVKPSPPAGQDSIFINLGRASRGEVTLGNATLSECVRFAYGLVSEEQIAGPDWIRDRATRFDIIAKAAPGTPREQLLLMLQHLLDERFKLQMHREPRRIPHYALVVAKNGPKMPAVEPGPGGTMRAYGKGRLVYSGVRMDALAMLISRQLKETVLDMTGLTGTYDVKLEWAPDGLRPPETQEAEDRAAGPSIFTAVQEQLGLKLEARKEPLDVLVVDRAEKVPVEN